jgi:predicted phage-related endonuclease
MAKEWEYGEKRDNIIISPPKQTLRITGHRLSSVLGLNKYQSPFGSWCEITKLVKLPFEDTKYTIAGKVIEPKLIDYMKTQLPNIVSIEDYYGNVFDEYRYNNFKDESHIFGGVIDAVSTLNDKKTITAIVECKTSSKPQDWANDMIPVDYLLQGALYSYMKGLKEIIFVCVFLDELDYAHPEEVKITKDNTIIRIRQLDDLIFDINGQYMNIEDCMQYAKEWWNKYIVTGISPEFDETLDKEYLDIIRATDAVQDNDLLKVCDDAFKLSQEIKNAKIVNGIDEMEKRLKLLENSIKKEMIDKTIDNCGAYTLSHKISYKFDEDTFMQEHEDLYKQYLNENQSYTLSKKRGE